jgi:predicted alpha-1,2-mannosidase
MDRSVQRRKRGRLAVWVLLALATVTVAGVVTARALLPAESANRAGRTTAASAAGLQAPSVTRAAGAAQSLLALADPFFGADRGGNTVPGARVPFGFVSLSPDTVEPGTSGYRSRADILGFSHTHLSGTGGNGKYGNFLVTPLVGPVRLNNLASAKSEERASPGYYTVLLNRDRIRAELTATRLAGMHRYTFPAVGRVHILIDAASVVETGPAPFRQQPLECEVRVLPPNRIEGTGNFNGGWNPAPYTLHFSAEFDRPFAAFGVWRNDKITEGSRAANGQKAGAYAAFDSSSNPVVQLRVGLSFLSPAKARANLEREMPRWDFEGLRRDAEAAWQRMFSHIAVEGGTEDQRRTFYSALYRAGNMPHDLSGENTWWDSSEPHYEDYCTIWDTFRTLHPLLTLIEPERQRDMVRSLIDIAEHTGWMPDSRVAGANGLTQGGTHADALIADAMVKGLKGIDYRQALRLMVKSAEVQSPRPFYEGRELRDYLRLGYMSLDYDRSASRTLEYAFNDFCIAQVARGLGEQAIHRRFLKRSGNWANVWDDNYRAMRPRHADGSWLEPFSRDFASGWWSGPFYEGSSWQYSTFVPHDPQGLINRVGGDQAYVDWLDEFFDTGKYNPGNEPDILAAYLYIHAARPDRTAERVRRLLATYFRPGRAGLPGNDDSAAMSTWFIWGAIGLYPNTGQDFYYIGSPLFERARIDVGGGRSFTIEARGTSESAKYVRSATLNGKPLQRAFLRHAEILAGGTLSLVMGTAPSDWGRAARPPSVSSPMVVTGPPGP